MKYLRLTCAVFSCSTPAQKQKTVGRISNRMKQLQYVKPSFLCKQRLTVFPIYFLTYWRSSQYLSDLALHPIFHRLKTHKPDEKLRVLMSIKTDMSFRLLANVV